MRQEKLTRSGRVPRPSSRYWEAHGVGERRGGLEDAPPQQGGGVGGRGGGGGRRGAECTGAEGTCLPFLCLYAKLFTLYAKLVTLSQCL